MADNLLKKPSKGILKNSSSFDKPESHSTHRKSIKETTWDEMNIMATLHPADKDYGHMKIDEPKTPYNYLNPDHVDGLNLAELEQKIKKGADLPPKALLGHEDDSDDDDDDDLTPEEKAKKREFETKRKKHYNEYYAVKLARKLLEEDEDDEEDQTPKQSPKHKARDESCSKSLPN